MIGSLRGWLVDQSGDGDLLIEVYGVGYRVQVTASTLANLGELDSEIVVHVHHAVREDSEALYGFATISERRLFESLIGTHGVGPALALAILSVHSPDSLRRAVADDDTAALCLVPGVGRKTAARLIMELKSKLDIPESVVVSDGLAPTIGGTVADVRSALSGLGYGSDEIGSVLGELPGDADAADMLKHALRLLADR